MVRRLPLASCIEASTNYKKRFSSLLITLTRAPRCFSSFGVGKYGDARKGSYLTIPKANKLLNNFNKK